jgi:signal transduction histidine kinase
MPRTTLSWRARVRAWRWPGLASFRLRLFFRGVFLGLALATVAIALLVLQDEKRLADRSYRAGFAKTMAQVSAQLRHPAGQLALLNPPSRSPSPAASGASGVHPLVLPFAALDFDDRNKVEQAVEMAGCSRQYPGDAALCVAVGSSPWAGGFVYVVGHLSAPPVVAHARGERDLAQASRLRVDLALRGQNVGWTAPYEAETVPGATMQRGHLAGFADDAQGAPSARPDRDFRGWLWQGGPCLSAHGASASRRMPDGEAAPADCLRRTSFSVRLPVDALRADVVSIPNPVWPPTDLDRIDVRVRWLAPGDDDALFDSARPGATPPFSLADLAPLLLPGETLQVRRAGAPPDAPPLFTLTGAEAAAPAAPGAWLATVFGDRLERAIAAVIRRLPVEGDGAPVEAEETLRTPAGSFVVRGIGTERGASGALAAVATRVSWFVLAMLAALAFAWLAIELAIIRRIAMLATRSRAVTAAVVEESEGGAPRPARWSPLDIADLRGSDELGVLASNLAEALQRVAEGAQRERVRAQQERDQWMAVGHEIMSPLQSLIALHAAPDDESRRYILRMQQAIRVLYGSASPSEAFQSTTLQLATLELGGFLAEVAANAPHAGIADVRLEAPDERVVVRAEAYSLEDAITHVLQNADRHRVPGTPITMRLSVDESRATIAVHNRGETIVEAMLERIFEYGVSGDPLSEDRVREDAETPAGAAPQRGQGLFVARTYLAKMAGTILARNADDGVWFVMTLPRASG